MKRLIIAAAFVTTAAYADIGKPFEQLDLDRALPTSLPNNVAAHESIPPERLPYEQSQVDRGDNRQPARTQPERVQVVQVGNASYKSGDASDEAPARSPWANDHNFIAPAQ
jgi:hypothetical protein